MVPVDTLAAAMGSIERYCFDRHDHKLPSQRWRQHRSMKTARRVTCNLLGFRFREQAGAKKIRASLSAKTLHAGLQCQCWRSRKLLEVWYTRIRCDAANSLGLPVIRDWLSGEMRRSTAGTGWLRCPRGSVCRLTGDLRRSRQPRPRQFLFEQ
jgi:ribosomal protein L28